MKLWLLSQTKNNGYDTYDAVVVAAPTGDAARTISPCSVNWTGSSWVTDPKDVDVKYIGTAARGTKAGIILSSFNAG